MVEQSRYNQVVATASSVFATGIIFQGYSEFASYQVFTLFPCRIEVIVAQILSEG
jgi:hypothetical protein